MLIKLFLLLNMAVPDTSINKVEIKGLVEHQLVIDHSNINAFAPEVHRDFKITGSTGETKRVLNSFKGVSLKRILDSAKIIMPKPKEKGKYYIAVKASDGYTTLYAWNEIYNNPTGDHVFLVFEEDGEPIKEGGKFVTICSNDKLTGPRHVKWVQSIEVGKLP